MEQNNRNDVSLFDDICSLIEQMKPIYGQAVSIYTPQVEHLCKKKATENEVDLMLDGLLSFASDERILDLFKKVGRRYFFEYPDVVGFYVLEYKKQYDPESLVGTEYEYLLHETEIDED